jgi:6-phosphogluconolactonase
MSKPEIIVCRNLDEAARVAAEQFVALAGPAIGRTGRFTVALSGGSTPRPLYARLAADHYRRLIDWPRVHFFWGDERCVPPDHPDSNFRAAEETLLARVPVAASNIHRMNGEGDSAEAAVNYEQELRGFFAPAPGALPRFDLILLGIGEDGHTASLFPGTAALDEAQRWVAAVYVEKLESHRLTLTLPVINAAAQVTFLVAGSAKGVVLRQILSRAEVDLPAARVRPAGGSLVWIITEDAAARSKQSAGEVTV